MDPAEVAPAEVVPAEEAPAEEPSFAVSKGACWRSSFEGSHALPRLHNGCLAELSSRVNRAHSFTKLSTQAVLEPTLTREEPETGSTTLSTGGVLCRGAQADQCGRAIGAA